MDKPCPPKLVCMHLTSIPTCMNFLGRFQSIKYSPWSEGEIWPFLKVAISPKLRRPHPLKLVYMHLTSIPTFMNFLGRFQSIKYSPWSEGEIWPFLKVAISPKLRRPRPLKLVYMHLTSIPTCINFLGRFRLIKFFDDSPWSEGEIWLFLKVAISPKLRRTPPPKLVYMHLTSIPTCMNLLGQFRLIKFFDDHELK